MITKKAKILFFMELEDAKQELYVAMIKAINGMTFFHSEGECINYIKKAIDYRIKELQKMNLKDREITYGDFDWQLESSSIGEIEFKLDFEKNIKNLSEKKRYIIYMVLMGYSDVEIAKCMNISRQYVNRVKKAV